MLLLNEIAHQQGTAQAVVDALIARPAFFVEEILDVGDAFGTPTGVDTSMTDQAGTALAKPVVSTVRPAVSSLTVSKTTSDALPYFVHVPGRTIGVSTPTPQVAATRPLSPIIRRSLDSQATTLKDMGDDWDGEGAIAVPAGRIDLLKSELEILLGGYLGPLVDLAPGSDGSLQAEWRLPGGIELNYGIDPSGNFYFIREEASEHFEASGVRARRALSESLSSYFGNVGTPPVFT